VKGGHVEHCVQVFNMTTLYLLCAILYNIRALIKNSRDGTVIV